MRARSSHLRARLAARLLATALGLGALATATPAAASAAAFFPKGSSGRVDRLHVTVAIGPTRTITWSAIDWSGADAGVGVLVAVKAGGRVEIAPRAFVDVIEDASRVVISSIDAASCKPIATATVTIDGGLSIPSTGSGGCNGEGTASGNGGGGGGCWSESSSEGCNPTPSDNGHPGCSAFSDGHPGCGAMKTTGCSPTDNGGSTPIVDAGVTNRVGPYAIERVRGADGSAQAWLDAGDLDGGASFGAAIAALEADGWELYGIRALAPTDPKIAQSLRVITTSPAPTIPLRLARMGAGSRGALTPITLVTLGPAAQRLVDVNALRIDTAKLTSGNYETLVAGLLGFTQPPPSDAGAAADAGADAGGDAGAGGDADAGGDAGADAGGDAGTGADAGAGPCASVDRQRCDDLDLAIADGQSATATRYRGVIAGDPATIKDLALAAATDAIPEGRFTVRADGTAGLCEPIAVSASAEGEAQCGQARRRAGGPDFGPIFLVITTIAALAGIMRRARR